MPIQNCDFYKTVNILADFADWDTTARLNHSLRAWCDYKDSEFYQYEILLGKTMNILAGVSSSLSYMRISILQVEREKLSKRFEQEGFKEYDLYRYHYIVFSHSIALLQDLLFKLTSLVFGLNVPERMIGWKDLEKELKKNNLAVQKLIFEEFYKTFSNHINKRNTFSHEGLLTYNTLENFYMTIVWSHASGLSKLEENKYPQYTKGNVKNTELLQTTKEHFLDELNELSIEAEQFARKLCDSCIEKLLSQIDVNFLKNHCEHIKPIGCSTINDYLFSIGL